MNWIRASVSKTARFLALGGFVCPHGNFFGQCQVVLFQSGLRGKDPGKGVLLEGILEMRVTEGFGKLAGLGVFLLPEKNLQPGRSIAILKLGGRFQHFVER